MPFLNGKLFLFIPFHLSLLFSLFSFLQAFVDFFEKSGSHNSPIQDACCCRWQEIQLKINFDLIFSDWNRLIKLDYWFLTKITAKDINALPTFNLTVSHFILTLKTATQNNMTHMTETNTYLPLSTKASIFDDVRALLSFFASSF